MSAMFGTACQDEFEHKLDMIRWRLRDSPEDAHYVASELLELVLELHLRLKRMELG